MRKVLQISIEVNSGSVGRIAEQIGELALENEWESYITYARNHLPSKSKTIRIGNSWDIIWHGIMTRIFDNHCFESRHATRNLVKNIKLIKPDIIHLHHLHGYFINIDILFKYLSQAKIPIVWTFHDCWAFTGHCVYFDYIGCNKWKTQCSSCPQKREYPKSLVFDRSKLNYIQKKKLFNSVKNMTIVPVSNWLGALVKGSFLSKYDIHTIQNGIDLNHFTPKDAKFETINRYQITGSFIILGVASTWEKRKGLYYFLQLQEIMPSNYQIVLVGLNDKQIKVLPKGIIGIKRTENIQQLAELYASADVFINPTLEDTFPTTNLEALACGTPVVTFRTGGSTESVNDDVGLIVEKGDTLGLLNAIQKIEEMGKTHYTIKCRQRAIDNYNKKDKFHEYIDLYKSLLNRE